MGDPWDVETIETHQQQVYQELVRTLEGAVDAFLVTGESPALVQTALRNILCIDLIARQDGIMAMMDARYEQEDQEPEGWYK